MPNSWAIGLDLGTTAVKAVLVNPQGDIAATASRPAPLDERLREGAAEIPLGAYREAAEGALDAVLREAPRKVPMTLGISSQRSSVVIWDANTGRAWGPGLSWRDRRVAQPWPPPGLTEAEAVRRTGLRLSPHYSAGKIARLLARHGRKRGIPHGLKAAPLGSWLAWHWSAGGLPACDPTLAARMLLWNLEEGRWDSSLLRAFGIPRRILPRVLPSSGRHGTVRRDGRALDLRGMVGDQQAAAIALGLAPETGLLNLGTGAFLLVPTGRLTRAPGLLSTALWTEAGRSRFALEGTVNSAGALFDWFRRRGLGDPSSEPLPSPAEALRLPACLPALAGTGAPRWLAEDRLTFISEEGNRAPRDAPSQARRSALLSLAYRLREIWEALPTSQRPRRLLASGGLASCRPLLQAVADLLKVPVMPASRQQASAMGAALLAQGRAGRIRPPQAVGIIPRADRDSGYRRWRRLLDGPPRR